MCRVLVLNFNEKVKSTKDYGIAVIKGRVETGAISSVASTFKFPAFFEEIEVKRKTALVLFIC